MQKPKINSEITAPELRVIGPNKENLGVLSRAEALALAKPDTGLDLIEIAANAKPPVARLMSFDKYRYEQGKAEKKERLAQKTVGMKQVQISARAGLNDLAVKIRQLEGFLAEGHPIEVQMRLRGREKGNKDWARHKLNDFLQMITTEYRITSEPRFAGRGMIVQLTKK